MKWRNPFGVIVTLLLFSHTASPAQHLKAGKTSLVRISDDSVRITMPIELKEYQAANNEVLLIRPIIVSSSDSLLLPSVGIYGGSADLPGW